MPYPVVEIYGPTIYGDGDLIGRACHVVRFGGCDFDCHWCDSPHAVKARYRGDWGSMDAKQIARNVGMRLATGLVRLDGGNPALLDLTPLIDELHADHNEVAVETQGSVAPAWLSRVDHLVLSPKPPSSGMSERYSFDTLMRCIRLAIEGEPETTLMPSNVTLKFAIADEIDFAWCKDVADSVHDKLRGPWPFNVIVQPVNPFATVAQTVSLIEGGDGRTQRSHMSMIDLAVLMDRLVWLEKQCVEKRWNVRVLPQLNVLMYGGTRPE